MNGEPSARRVALRGACGTKQTQKGIEHAERANPRLRMMLFI
jgi:hypothetical protein